MNEQYDVFISYNTQDHALVTALATHLKDQQVKVFLDRWHLIPGQPWPERLRAVLASCSAVAVCIGPNEMGPWQSREMYFALERQNREQGFPVIPLLLPNANPALDFLSQNMWVDFRSGIDEPMALNILLSAIRREALDPDLRLRLQETIHTICPYRGLHFFREQDADFFFGRDKAITALQDKLKSYNFVALVGASGAGKSSVVRAGLLPKLRKDTQEPWEMVTIVPGDLPFENLAAGLVPLLESEKGETDLVIEISKLAKAFRDGTVQIRTVVERILKKQPGTERFLLVVDQWEELYTLAKSKQQSPTASTANDQVRCFIDGLLDATDAGVLNVVMTLRGDFMGAAIAYGRLSDAMQKAQINLRPMNTEELQQAIEEPARKLKVAFETGLVDALLTDVEGEPGNLPLLEFVLERLWQDDKRHGGALRYQAYCAMNRLKGALAQKADDLYNNLPTDTDRHQLRHILLQLVHSGENADYTRRRASLDDLSGSANLLIDRLTDARLLVSNQDEKTGNNTLEVAHEALIRDWPQFQQWLKDDRDFLLWRERLRNARAEWQPSKHVDLLLDGQRLDDARRWLKLKKDELNTQEKAFIDKSSRHSKLAKVKTAAFALAPVVLVAWFLLWSISNNFSPKVGWYVLWAKTGIYTLQPEIVTIPSGNFSMGSEAGEDNEKPVHTVNVNSFALGKYEVTFDEYQVFAYMVAGDGGCKNIVNKKPHVIRAINDSGFGKGQHPVINVSWHDAQCYGQWLSQKTHKYYRLPTEAEWEYAARAETKGDYYWEQEDAKEYAWSISNSEGKTHLVGQLKDNKFDLHDMSGNVQEWVQDCWHGNYKSAPVNGFVWMKADKGDCDHRVFRGGSWGDGLRYLRSTYRFGVDADEADESLGFRIARELQPFSCPLSIFGFCFSGT